MLTCKELTDLVTDRLEGRLSFRQRVSFELHVGMCRHCRAYLRQMKATIRALGRLPPEPPPPAVQDELLARFRHAHPRSSDARAARAAGPVARPVARIDAWLGAGALR